MRFSVFISDTLIAFECVRWVMSCLTYSVDREAKSRPQGSGIALDADADPMRLSLKRNCGWSFMRCSACLGLMAAIAYEQHSITHNATKFSVIGWEVD